MELVNTNDEISFDPTPKLKSSPIPILFISFNEDDVNCIHCGDTYVEALFHKWQKYCKKCLSSYITEIIADNNIYLDVYFLTRNLECSEHEMSETKEPQNIQECCRNCMEILCFKQIPIYHLNYNLFSTYNLIRNIFESEKYCKLCGKSLCEKSLLYNELRLC